MSVSEFKSKNYKYNIEVAYTINDSNVINYINEHKNIFILEDSVSDDFLNAVNIPEGEMTYYSVGKHDTYDLLTDNLNNFILEKAVSLDSKIIFVGGASFLSSILKVKNDILKDYSYVIVPTTLKAINKFTVVEDDKLEYVGIIISFISTISDPDYFNGFAYYMRDALIKDANFYSWLIDKMYEICERDTDCLKEMIEKSVNIKNIIISTNKKGSFNDSIIGFGREIQEAVLDYEGTSFKDGEALALGCVASAFISYKRNWLNKDEYYEIRDMFVPFYLPISIEMIDIDNMLKLVLANCSINNDNYSMTLIKKVGKALTDDSVTAEDIKNSIEELNFDEAW